MAFSLSKWFKGSPNAPETASPPDKPAAPAPTGPHVTQRNAVTRVTRTVPAMRKAVPNSVHPVSLRDPQARPVQLPVSTPPPPAAPRPKISFGPGSSAPSAAVAPAAVTESTSFPPAEPALVAPVPEMVVNLDVGDFIDRIPTNLLGAGVIDRQRSVQFHSTELYSDLAKGRASVPASVIYQKCPDLFAHPVTETEDAEVLLPLARLVAQMSPVLLARADQLAEENVGEIETPFLQVAMEDNARLARAAGSNAGAVIPQMAAPAVAAAPASVGGILARPPQRTGQIQTISTLKAPPEAPAVPAIPAAPAAANTGAIIPGKRPPSTVRASVAGGKIRLSGPSMPNRMSAVAREELPPSESQMIAVPVVGSPSHLVAKKTARIQIPPISLRTSGTSTSALRPPSAAPAAPALSGVPPVVPSGPVPMRGNPGGESAHPPITFRLSPPPPSAKTMPHSFAPPPRPSFPPPAFPVVPPVSGAPLPSGAPIAPAAVPLIASAPPVSLPPPPPVLPPRPTAPDISPVAPAPVDERRITLGLGAVLRGLSASLLSVDPSTVPDEVRLTLPFSLVEPQLGSGRVAVPRAAFNEALPEGYGAVLDQGGDLPEVPLPLQEVFQNLPSNALTMRADQVTENVAHLYPTPFSQKAEEDAQRLGVGDIPTAPRVPSAAVTPATPKDVAAPAPAAEPPAPELATDRPLPADEPPAAEGADHAAVEEPGAPVDDAPPAPVADEVTEQPLSRDVPLDFDEPGESAQPTAASEPAAEAVSPTDIEPDSEPTAPANEGQSALEDSAALQATAAFPAEAEPAPTPVAAEPSSFTTAAETESVPQDSAAATAEPAILQEPETKPEPNLEFVDRPQAQPVTAPETVPLVRTPHTHAALQALFMVEEDMDAKTVVKLVSQLPGLSGCAVMFGDGLRLAGNFPEESQAEGFSAMAPPFYKRAAKFTREAQIGSLQAFTIFTDAHHYSFFMHEDICLSVRHSGRGFLPGVREKLDFVVRELARMYSSAQPGAPAA